MPEGHQRRLHRADEPRLRQGHAHVGRRRGQPRELSLDGFARARDVGPGATIAIVAPSGPFDRAEFDAGLARLRERYRVRVADDVHAREGFLAGGDARRTAELLAAIDDPAVDAIVCARGGYGATRILPAIPVERVRAAGKRLVGFSDVTALHALWARASVRSVHGAMVVGLGRGEGPLPARWVEALEGAVPEPLEALLSLAPGRASGPLLGGNLAVLTALLGTPHLPPLDGAVLFLEDVGERPYRVDRMLTQLEQAGVFARVRAVLLGGFTDGPPGKDGVAIDDVLRERLGGLGIPVLTGIPSGHLDDNLELPFGNRVQVDARADAGRLVFEP